MNRQYNYARIDCREAASGGRATVRASGGGSGSNKGDGGYFFPSRQEYSGLKWDQVKRLWGPRYPTNSGRTRRWPQAADSVDFNLGAPTTIPQLTFNQITLEEGP
jgi:hypothetical protein